MVVRLDTIYSIFEGRGNRSCEVQVSKVIWQQAASPTCDPRRPMRNALWDS